MRVKDKKGLNWPSQQRYVRYYTRTLEKHDAHGAASPFPRAWRGFTRAAPRTDFPRMFTGVTLTDMPERFVAMGLRVELRQGIYKV